MEPSFNYAVFENLIYFWWGWLCDVCGVGGGARERREVSGEELEENGASTDQEEEEGGEDEFKCGGGIAGKSYQQVFVR